MDIHVTCQVLLTVLVTAKAQFMQPMQAPIFPQQPMMPMGLTGGMQPSMPMMPSMPHLPGMPPMPPSMSMPLNGGRLPMVVMPHHTRRKENKRYKKRRTKKRTHKRLRIGSSSSDESCDSDTDYEFRSKNDLRSLSSKPKPGRRQVLTPVVSYVTKDGYVVYEKKIKRDKAKEWLEMTQAASEESKHKHHHDHHDH